MVGIGLYIRLGILETPAFTRILEAARVERTPVIEVIKRQPKQIVLTALCRMAEQGPVLCLCRLYLYLWNQRSAQRFARFPAHRGFDRDPAVGA